MYKLEVFEKKTGETIETFISRVTHLLNSYLEYELITIKITDNFDKIFVAMNKKRGR